MVREGACAICLAAFALTAGTGCGGSSSQSGGGTAPPPSASYYAYVTYIPGGNTQKGNLMTYSEVSGKLSVVGSAISAQDACGLTVSPNNKFLYVALCGGGWIQPYSINPSTGELTAVGNGTPVDIPGPSGGFITPLVVAPNGKFAYVVNESPNPQQSVVTYSIGGDGSLTAVGSPVLFNKNGWLHISLAIAPAGNFLYIGYWGQGEVYAYAVDASSGGLTSVAGSPFALNGGTTPISYDPVALTVAASGNYLYAPGDSGLSIFSVASGAGALTAMNPYSGGLDGPMILNSVGNMAYMQTSGSGWVGTYSIDTSTGALSQTQLVNSSFLHGDGIALDPSGAYLYALWTENPSGGEGEVSIYAVDSSTGAITYLGPASGTSGTWPTGIAFATE